MKFPIYHVQDTTSPYMSHSHEIPMLYNDAFTLLHTTLYQSCIHLRAALEGPRDPIQRGGPGSGVIFLAYVTTTPGPSRG